MIYQDRESPNSWKIISKKWNSLLHRKGTMPWILKDWGNQISPSGLCEITIHWSLSELDPIHGEIKSMRTSPALKRKGIASSLLRHIIEESLKCGYQRLSLETGSMDFFHPARKLYEKFGFAYCQPFSDYKADSNSVFMTKELKLISKWIT